MKTYDIVIADPPWRYSFSRTNSRKVENHYPTMTIEEIMDFDVPANKNALLYMWATAPKLKEAMMVIDAWGFTYKTNMVWEKHRIGMGYWARSKHELVLIAKRGKFSPPEPADRISSIFQAVPDHVHRHSRKPKFLHDYLDKCYPDMSKVELFARDAYKGWDVMGVDVEESVWEDIEEELPEIEDAFDVEEEFVEEDGGWAYE